MAISKLKPRKISDGKSIRQYLADRIDYGKNPEKTDGGRLVSTYQCSPETAAEEFVISKRLYANLTGRSQPRERDVLSYFLLQSFRPGEITPEKAHQMGYQLALEFTGGNHAFVVSTHIDREHIHTHIEFNSTNLECTGKFRNVKNSYLLLQKISDRLCQEHGLSVIAAPKGKGEHYAQWKEEKKGTSYKANLRQTIDRVILESRSFEEFLAKMRSEGYEVSAHGLLKFRAAGQERFTRSRTLGAEYSEESLREKIYGKTKIPVPDRRKVNLLIDIQSKLAAGKGKGYEYWAKVFNLKEAARTLNFLTEAGISDYAQLEQREAEVSARFQELSGRMKRLEGRMAEAADLKYHIIRYSKTCEIYRKYQQAKDKAGFYREYAEEITQHEAAKKAFDAFHGEKLPTVSELQSEYRKLLNEKQGLGEEFAKLKKEMQNYRDAKKNVDQILQVEKGEKKEKEKEKGREER